MRILIVGGDGMLGHQLFLTLKNKHEVKVTLRQNLANYHQYQLFDNQNSYAGIDVRVIEDLLQVINDFKPQAVINCVGIIKQRKSAKEAIPSLEINSLFPHRLALICKAINARMIHMSTDCIFSGKKGGYTEDDVSDAEDLYGKSKYLGEVHDPHCLTIRSSIIGLELSRNAALIEWFLAQNGAIKGFKRAIYSGLTTQEMSRLINRLLEQHPDLSGVWHVSSDPINKYDLLCMFSQMLGRTDVQIEPEEQFVCDRSLRSEYFKQKTNYQAPAWRQMLEELAEQVKMRKNIRKNFLVPEYLAE